MTYSHTREHLHEELDRIDTILDEYLRLTEGGPPAGPGVDHGNDPGVDPGALQLALPEEARAAVAAQAEEIDRRCERTEDVRLRLRTVAERFDLSRNHLDVLLLAVAPDVDTRYEQRCRDVHGETSVTKPTVEFLASLFARGGEESMAATALVGPGSPLREHGLVTLSDPVGTSTSHRRRLVSADPRLVSYLEGHDDVDPALGDAVSAVEPTTTVDDLRLEADTRERVVGLAETARESGRVHYFYGPDGAEKRRAVEALADGKLLRADLAALLDGDLLERFRREALLVDCAVHLTNVGEATATEGAPDPADRDDETGRVARPTVEDVVEALSVLERDRFLTATGEWTPTSSAGDATYALVEFPKPGFELRRRCWAAHADELADAVDPAVLASTFELTQAGVDDAVATARAVTTSGSADGEALSREAVVDGCKAQSATGLDDLAQQIEPDATWADIVLPSDTERQLREVSARVKHRGTVADEWGFEDRFSRGTGVVALFGGPSGTGKTLAAEVVATDAGMDIYRVDLSSIVSKYIGETEENLERIFDAARDSNAILLFDEADAVFGQRAGVSDATDRYANVEVNYLLQRIERYDGVVLLTTNNESQIDDAFVRRIHQTVSFQQPDRAARERIWRITFPEATPTDGLDYEFLSTLELSGGNVRNVAQTAAVLAADDDGVVGMRHVVEACQRELDKLGGFLDPADFEEYSHLLESTASGDDPTTPDRSDSPAPDGNASPGSAGTDASRAPTGSPERGAADEPTAKELLSGGGDGRASREPPGAPVEGSDRASPDRNGGPARPERTADGHAGVADADRTDDPNGSAPSSQRERPGGTDDAGHRDGAAGTAGPTGDDATDTTADGPDPEPSTTDPGPEDSRGEPTGGSDADPERTRADDAGDRTAGGPSGTPELVVEEFFGYLDDGDRDAAHRLYHSKGFAEEFSAREAAILDQCALSVGGFDRVESADDRVVVQFTQTLDGNDEPLEYELRPEDGSWRIFDLGRPSEDLLVEG